MSLAVRIGWTGVILGLLAQVVAYLLAIAGGAEAPAVAWLTVAGIAGTMAGTLVLGALRRGRLSRVAGIAALLLFLIPLLGFGAVLLMGPAEGGGLVLALPPRAAVVLFGVGLLPVLVFPLAYALDAADAGLGPEEIAALRAECRRAMGEGQR